MTVINQLPQASDGTELTTLLWTNQNPNQAFNEQNITLNNPINLFSAIRIAYKYNSLENNTILYVQYDLTPTGGGSNYNEGESKAQMTLCARRTLTRTLCFRPFRFVGEVSENNPSPVYNQIHFDSCSSINGVTYEENCIPLNIYGIR